MRAQRVKPSAEREVAGVFANFKLLKLEEEQKIHLEHENKK